MWLRYIFHHLAGIPIINPQYIQAFLLTQWLYKFGSKKMNVSNKSAIIFAPHQDDETFGCGGLIALKTQLKVPVAIVFMTDGQRSHLHTPWIKPPDNLIETRRQEAITALEILGVRQSAIHFLNLVDGTLNILTKEQNQNIIKRLVDFLQIYQPEEVYVPHQKDNHTDHESTYKLVKLAIELSKMQIKLLQYPIWMFWESPLFIKIKPRDLTNAYRLEIQSVLERKKQAISAYKSQYSILPASFVKGFMKKSYEIFFLDSWSK
jgi:LmbE family N-acetylglucosaminyl deacetylase